MRFSSTELAGIRQARANNPTMPQRELAGVIYGDYIRYNIEPIRTQAAIYGALRRTDAQDGVKRANGRKYANPVAA